MARHPGSTRDPALVLPLEGRTLFSGPATPHPLEILPGSAPLDATVASAQVMSLAALPQLSSLSGAPAKLYLNFGGAAAQRWGTYNATATPAFDTDGDATTFTTTEVNQIKEIWSRVAEKFSPFNVDVTTVDPGTYPYGAVARMVIGGDGAWSGGLYGGYSFVGGFTGGVSNTGWIFSKNLGSGFPKYVAEATAHEAGHLFGLQHQSNYDASGSLTDEYSRGNDAVGPIMGASYYAQRGLWSLGTATSPYTTQDDLGFIAGAANGFGYRPDDHGSTRALAAMLDVVNGVDAHGAGVIERVTDVDYFRFTSTGGLVSLAARVAEFGPMLDLSLQLTDADGNVLFAADTASLGESISGLVSAGDYYLAVSSHGGYGDVGQYTIEGTVVPEPLSAPLALGMGAAWLLQRRQRRREKVESRAHAFARATVIEL